MDAVRFGLQIRVLRRRRGWTQEGLGRRAGLSKSAISRIERGGIAGFSFAAADRLVAPLAARLSVRILWQGEELDRLLDGAHAALVDSTLTLLGDAGWETWPEATFAFAGERGSIDVLAYHGSTRSLLVIEVKSVVPDVQSMLAGLDRKARVASRVGRGRGWEAQSVSRVLVLPGDRTSRRRIARFGATFDRSLPARTREIKQWFAAPDGAIAGILFLPNSSHVQPRHRVRQGNVSRTHAGRAEHA